MNKKGLKKTTTKLSIWLRSLSAQSTRHKNTHPHTQTQTRCSPPTHSLTHSSLKNQRPVLQPLICLTVSPISSSASASANPDKKHYSASLSDKLPDTWKGSARVCFLQSSGEQETSSRVLSDTVWHQNSASPSSSFFSSLPPQPWNK